MAKSQRLVAHADNTLLFAQKKIKKAADVFCHCRHRHLWHGCRRDAHTQKTAWCKGWVIVDEKHPREHTEGSSLKRAKSESAGWCWIRKNALVEREGFWQAGRNSRSTDVQVQQHREFVLTLLSLLVLKADAAIEDCICIKTWLKTQREAGAKSTRILLLICQAGLKEEVLSSQSAWISHGRVLSLQAAVGTTGAKTANLTNRYT